MTTKHSTMTTKRFTVLHLPNRLQNVVLFQIEYCENLQIRFGIWANFRDNRFCPWGLDSTSLKCPHLKKVLLLKQIAIWQSESPSWAVRAEIQLELRSSKFLNTKNTRKAKNRVTGEFFQKPRRWGIMSRSNTVILNYPCGLTIYCINKFFRMQCIKRIQCFSINSCFGWMNTFLSGHPNPSDTHAPVRASPFEGNSKGFQRNLNPDTIFAVLDIEQNLRFSENRNTIVLSSRYDFNFAFLRHYRRDWEVPTHLNVFCMHDLHRYSSPEEIEIVEISWRKNHGKKKSLLSRFLYSFSK